MRAGFAVLNLPVNQSFTRRNQAPEPDAAAAAAILKNPEWLVHAGQVLARRAVRESWFLSLQNGSPGQESAPTTAWQLEANPPRFWAQPMNTQDREAQAQQQEVHLLRVAWATGAPRQGDSPPPLRLGQLPTRIAGERTVGPNDQNREDAGAVNDALLEPFLNTAKQMRILAVFPRAATVHVNGEPAPRRVVLAPGDQFQWLSSLIFQVALYSKPLIGPPPPSALGKLCPNCRVPFTAGTTCLTCVCGVVLHCEPGEQGLQCAQMRRECPACKRPLALVEGYVNPPSHEG
jgi:hypothetical protein